MLGLVSSWIVCVLLYTRRDRRLVGLTERFAPARAGYVFVSNKYYLDALYDNVIVRSIAHPIANAAYWTNQHILDGIVNGVGRAGRRLGGWSYRNIDQRVVDGAVDGAGLRRHRDRRVVAPGAVGSGQPVRRPALRSGGHRRRRARHRERVEVGMEVLTDQNWLLSVGVFLPLVGVLVMLFIPARRGAAAQADRPADLARHPRASASTPSPSSTTTRPRSCSSSPTPSGSRRSGRTTSSASTGSACRCTCCRCSSRRS